MKLFIFYSEASEINGFEVEEQFKSRNGLKEEIEFLNDNGKPLIYAAFAKLYEMIPNADYGVIIISDDYFTNEKCMKALHVLDQSGRFEEKFVPLVLRGTEITNEGMKTYYKYWNQRYFDTYEMTREIPKSKNEYLWRELKLYNDISKLIGKIFYNLKNTRYLTISKYEIQLIDFRKETIDVLKKDNIKELNKLFEYLKI